MSSWERGAGRRQGRTAFEEAGFSARLARLEHALLEELRCILRDEARDPALACVRIVSLELRGGAARAIYGVTAEDADVAGRAAKEALVRATGFVRSELAVRLDVKRLPQLAFAFIGKVEDAS